MTRNLLFAALLLVCATSAQAQAPGSLDNSFGGNGHVSTDVSGGNRYDEYATGVFVQPDGKRVVVVDRYPYIQLIRFNADGSYDNTYGDNGFSQAASIRRFGPNSNAAMQSDGKIVVTGETPFNETTLGDFGVARWNTNGSLDATFGNQGVATVNFGYDDTGQMVRIQSDGKIVVAGELFINGHDMIGLTRLNTDGSIDGTYGAGGSGKYVAAPVNIELDDMSFTPDGKLVTMCDYNDNDFTLIRFGANGIIDTGFGIQGILEYDYFVGTYDPFVGCMAIQSDGKILIGGELYNGFNSDMFVSRFTAAGTIDNTFHPGGYVTTHIGGSEEVRALKLQSDGKIVAAGDVFYGNLPTVIALARYMPNGDLDGTFGVQGTQITGFSDLGYQGVSADAIALHADGDITVAGGGSKGLIAGDVTVATYDVQGAPDVDGYPVQRIAAFYADNGLTYYLADAVQSDGKPLAAGYVWNGHGYDMLVSRFNLDGTLDQSFGSGGSTIIDFADLQPGGSGDELGEALAIQDDGKIVVTGSLTVFILNGGLPVARLNTDGTLDASFGTGGRTIPDLPGIFEEGRTAVIQPDGKIVIAGNVLQGDFDFMLCRFNPNGTLDGTFGTGGVVTSDWGYQDEVFGLALQSDGKLVATGNTSDKNSFLGFDFNTARYNPDGSLDAGYGTGGRVTTDFGSSFDFAAAVTLQSNGSAVVAGGVSVSNDYDFGLARYGTTGTPDAGFGSGGKTTLGFGSYDIGNAVAIEKDGKILTAGFTDGLQGNTGPVDIALSRTNANGTPDASFGTSGKVKSDFGDQEWGFGMGLYKRRIYVAGVQRVWRDFTATDKYLGLMATYLTGPPPADELIGDQIGDITNLPGVPAGTKNALNAKLNAALAALAIPDTAQACNNLQALLNQIKAQSGKKLTIEQAADLTADVLKIMATLRCSTQGQAQNTAIVDPMDMNPAAGAPTSFAMNGSSPNPFVGATRIAYQLPVPSKVSLKIYNVQGQVVATVIDRVEGPGFKSVSWDASRMPAGVYFARLQAGTFTAQRKLALVR